MPESFSFAVFNPGARAGPGALGCGGISVVESFFGFPPGTVRGRADIFLRFVCSSRQRGLAKILFRGLGAIIL